LFFRKEKKSQAKDKKTPERKREIWKGKDKQEDRRIPAANDTVRKRKGKGIGQKR